MGIKWLIEKRVSLYGESIEPFIEHARLNGWTLSNVDIKLIESGTSNAVTFGAMKAYLRLLGLELKIVNAE